MSDQVIAAEKPHVRLFVAVPIYSDCPGEFLMPMMNLSRSGLVEDAKVLTGSMIQRARNKLTFDFLLSGCTHVLWIDSDQVFTVDQVVRLLSHDKEIVSGCVSKKNQASNELDFSGIPLTSPPQVDANGLIELRYTGAGFLLVERQVFERMIGEHIKDVKAARDPLALHDFWPAGIHQDPDFPWPNGVKGGQFCMGEDYAFSLKARQLGYRIYADTRVIVWHIGRAIFPLDHQLRVWLKEHPPSTTCPEQAISCQQAEISQ